VTFLFTDIEGSTRRWEADAGAMRAALLTHDEVLRSAIEAHGGFMFKHTGDGVCAAFASPRSAVDAAVTAQLALELPVRMGLATGEAELRERDYFGAVLNRAARVMGAGHGGQILLAELIRGGAQLRPVRHPGNDIAPESGYRPSAALDAFVRSRDLACRFPNCDRPAEFCDVYHTIPYPIGPTHPSNLKCLCRKQDGPMTFCRVGRRGDLGVWGLGLAGSRNQQSRVGAVQPDADRGRGPAA
jgi:hypothetical protein